MNRLRLKMAFSLLLCVIQIAVASLLVAVENSPESTNQENVFIRWQRPDKWQSLGSIGFRLATFPKDDFIMLFPEWITAREKSWHVPPKWEFDGEKAMGTWQDGPYALEVTLQIQREGSDTCLKWKYVFTNGSEAGLTDVAAFNCFNLVDAPSFKDLKMKRTWVGAGEKDDTLLAEVEKTKGPRTLQFYPAKGGITLEEFERFSRYGANCKHLLSGDRIGVVSVDKQWSVQCVVDGPVAYFFNNWEADHGCVHAAPLLGDVAAGKTASASGKIVFKPAEIVK